LRTAGTIILAAVASSLVASASTVAAVYLGLGISLGPHQQFEVILLIVVQVIIALVAAAVLAIVLAFARNERTVDIAALTVAMLLVLALGALEAFGLTAGGSTAFSLGDTLAEDGPFLGVIAIPGLLTILIQWRSVRRQLAREQRT
jgi:chromate transport protein ChrA